MVKKEDGLLLHQHNCCKSVLLICLLEWEPPQDTRSTFRKCLATLLLQIHPAPEHEEWIKRGTKFLAACCCCCCCCCCLLLLLSTRTRPGRGTCRFSNSSSVWPRILSCWKPSCDICCDTSRPTKTKGLLLLASKEEGTHRAYHLWRPFTCIFRKAFPFRVCWFTCLMETPGILCTGPKRN